MNARTRVVAASIVVLALVVGTVSTYFILPRIAPGATSNSTSVSTLSSHSITTPTSASSSNSQRITTVINGTTVTIEGTMTYVCTVAVPPPQGTYLRVITDGVGTPVSGLQVTMQSEEVASCDRNNVKLTNSIEVTNSTGWTLFQQGYPWYFVFTYSGYIYNFTVPGSPMSWAVATISIPSGNLSTEICGSDGGSLNSCEAPSTSTVSTTPALQNATSATTSAASISSATCASATAGATCTASGSNSSGNVISLVVTASGSNSTTMHFEILNGGTNPANVTGVRLNGTSISPDGNGTHFIISRTPIPVGQTAEIDVYFTRGANPYGSRCTTVQLWLELKEDQATVTLIKYVPMNC